jgi:hypothetical protein
MKLLLAPLLAAALLAVAPSAPSPGAAPSPSTSPAATNSPEPMVPIGDSKVTAHDFAEFTAHVLTIYLPLKGGTVVGDVVEKAPAEMPANNHNYYYAGNTFKDGKTHITVWIAKGIDKDHVIFAMQAASALGLMDAGLSNPAFTALYAKAKAADEAAGPTAKDPWAHREDLADDIAATIMALLSK